MTPKDLLAGFKEGSITLLDGGHHTNPLVELLGDDIAHTDKMIKEHSESVKAGKVKMENGSTTYAGMLEHYKRDLRDIELGRSYKHREQYCFHCGSNLNILVLDEKTLAYVKGQDYWDIGKAKGDQYGYLFTASDIKTCAAKELYESKQLTSVIDVPSGELVFANYFKSEGIVEDLPKGEAYSEPGINSVLGRNRVMQYKASNNVGYGQMGNMSLTVFGNKKNKIVLGIEEDYLDEHLSGAYGDEDAQGYKDFKKEIKDEKLKHRGEISLSVWRWECADKSILDMHGEDLSELEGSVIVKVAPGQYQIDHYYDFSSGPVYSRISLIKEEV